MPRSSYQGATKAVQRESRYEIEENKARRYCLWQELGVLALYGKLRDNPC